MSTHTNLIEGPLDKCNEIIINGVDIISIEVKRERYDMASSSGGIHGHFYGDQVVTIICSQAQFIMKPKDGSAEPPKRLPINKLERFL